MGFFSRKKDESSNLPPAPMPPVAQGMDRLSASPMDVSKQAPYLSMPSVPSRSSLDDIKSQVISNGSSSNFNNMNNSNLNNQNFGANQMQPSVQESAQNSSSLADDALFDFSTLDLGEPQEEEIVSKPTTPATVSVTNSNVSRNAVVAPESQNSSYVDKNIINHEGSLSFVSNKNRFNKPGVNDNLFVTTSQFKTFLEIIEQVRVRVKDSSDRHLRLLDIKSEEDLEYENLRKDFQYIEDKLYEVDSLIFDR